MPVPLALAAEVVLGTRLEPVRVGDERAQVIDARLGLRGVGGEFLVPSPRSE